MVDNRQYYVILDSQEKLQMLWKRSFQYITKCLCSQHVYVTAAAEAVSCYSCSGWMDYYYYYYYYHHHHHHHHLFIRTHGTETTLNIIRRLPKYQVCASYNVLQPDVC